MPRSKPSSNHDAPLSRLFLATAILGGVGTGLGLFGMVTERGWVVWVAIGLVGVAFLLRFVDKQDDHR